LTTFPSGSTGTNSFFDRVNEFQTFSFASCDDFGSFHGGWVRVEVAMVATIVRRSGLLQMFLVRASGELVVKIWRDNERRPGTINMAAGGPDKERLEGDR
jgi:hypothetical protein